MRLFLNFMCNKVGKAFTNKALRNLLPNDSHSYDYSYDHSYDHSYDCSDDQQ